MDVSKSSSAKDDPVGSELTLDTNVAVQSSRDQSADHSQDVARGLPIVR